MWLFLATEILFFGGLFVAYAVYRGNHPEIFVFGHHFLDKNLGALNTVVLICSSLTTAWAVRAAQLRQIGMLKLMIVLTMVCAFGFMGVKASSTTPSGSTACCGPAATTRTSSTTRDETIARELHSAEPMSSLRDARRSRLVSRGETDRRGEIDEPNRLPTPIVPPSHRRPKGRRVWPRRTELRPTRRDVEVEPANAQIYFSIYFLMTGLHGIHVLGGIGAFALAPALCSARRFRQRSLHPSRHGRPLLARGGSDLDLPLPASVPD